MKTFQEYLTEAITVETNTFVRSHGKNPRGKGNWIFSTKQQPSVKELSDQNVVFEAGVMKFKEAKQLAIKHFKKNSKSISQIFVLP